MTMLMLDNTNGACGELRLTGNAIKAASRVALRCAVAALGVISIAGCTTSAEFRPISAMDDDGGNNNVTLSYIKGVPQLTSRGISTQVELTPLDNRVSNGDDLKLAVSVLNVGAPFFFGPDNVGVFRWKEFAVVTALSFDE